MLSCIHEVLSPGVRGIERWRTGLSTELPRPEKGWERQREGEGRVEGEGTTRKEDRQKATDPSGRSLGEGHIDDHLGWPVLPYWVAIVVLIHDKEDHWRPGPGSG